MGIDEVVQPLGQVRIGFRELEVVLVPCSMLTALPLNRRVESLRALLAGRRVIVTDCDCRTLLTEEAHDPAAEVRQAIITALEETRRQVIEVSGEEVTGPWNEPRAAGMSALVESIEDCVAFYLAKTQTLGHLSLPEEARLVMLGDNLYDLALEKGFLDLSDHLAIWRSRPWKYRVMAVDELPDRHRGENEQWPATDYSRHCESDGMREALAGALGMSDTLKAICYHRILGFAIGEAVGKEQSHGWLATDLKKEHFIYLAEGRVAHVDHSDDVFLLRDPTVDEMARCIGPLYQQFDFLEWQGFREGYFDALGTRALDVLHLFDGDPIHFVLFEYCNRMSRKLRSAGEFEEAIARLATADAIVKRMIHLPGSERERLSCQNTSILGDLHLQREALDDAEAAYLQSIGRLEKLEIEGLQVAFELCGALVNLAVISLLRKDEPRARRCFERAEKNARAMEEAEDERAEYVLEVIRRNLSELK